MADPLLVAALNAADSQLAGAYEGVGEWYVGHLDDHIYPTCPALKRSGHPIRRGSGRLYPEAGDCCGWCVRVWRARQAKTLVYQESPTVAETPAQQEEKR